MILGSRLQGSEAAQFELPAFSGNDTLSSSKQLHDQTTLQVVACVSPLASLVPINLGGKGKSFRSIARLSYGVDGASSGIL